MAQIDQKTRGPKRKLKASRAPFKHLGPSDRAVVERMHRAGLPRCEIAVAVGCSPSTITRELQRNAGRRGYSAAKAQEYADERKERSRRPSCLQPIQRKLTKLLQEGWSPDQIVGRLAAEGAPRVGRMTIYRYVARDRLAGGTLYQRARQGAKGRRHPRGVPAATPPERGWEARKRIGNRPPEVDARARVGDWEFDLVMLEGGAVLTAVERRTDFSIIELLPQGKRALPIARALVRRLAPFSRLGRVLTLTTDNGREFAAFRSIERGLGASVYFAHPYCSCDKPYIEHLNGLLRQYVPKGTRAEAVSPARLRRIEMALNNRPREALGFRTPREVLLNLPLIPCERLVGWGDSLWVG